VAAHGETPTLPYTDIFGECMLDETCAQDVRVVANHCRDERGNGTGQLQFGGIPTFFDVGIAEGHAVTFAGVGLAAGGLKPVVAIYSTFLQRAYEPIILHDCALQKSSGGVLSGSCGIGRRRRPYASRLLRFIVI